MLAIALFFALAVDESVTCYTMQGCGPCEQLKADYRSDPDLFGDRKVRFVDVRKERTPGIRVVPTLVLSKDGKEVKRTTGYGGKEDLQKWLED
jgi:hypothetical protein